MRPMLFVPALALCFLAVGHASANENAVYALTPVLDDASSGNCFLHSYEGTPPASAQHSLENNRATVYVGTGEPPVAGVGFKMTLGCRASV